MSRKKLSPAEATRVESALRRAKENDPRMTTDISTFESLALFKAGAKETSLTSIFMTTDRSKFPVFHLRIIRYKGFNFSKICEHGTV